MVGPKDWERFLQVLTMPVYIALLRGINLAGHNSIRMAELACSFEALGFKQVKTYIQSGNVVFNANKTAPATLSKQIEAKILAEFGLTVYVLTKTAEELKRAIEHNPFVKERGIDLTRLHVTFLSAVPAESGLNKVKSWRVEPDRFSSCGCEIYLHCPEAYGTTKLSNAALEKALEVRATTRNWRTVNKLYEMVLECGQ